MSIWLITRESVKAALDVAETARANPQLDRAIASASQSAQGYLHREFTPFIGTRYFDWPSRDQGYNTIWFGKYGLISASSVTFNGVALLPSDYFLEPANAAPPYEWLEANRGRTGFTSGDTPQRNAAITGEWGYDNLFVTAGALAAQVANTTDTSVTVNAACAATVGVGSLLKIESEFLPVVARSWADSAVDTTASVASSANATAIPVGSGSAFVAGERILIDSEVMLIQEIAGNTLIVKRAWDGSALAAHDTAANVYASRLLTVRRGAQGSTAAAHSNLTAISVWEVPPLLVEFTLALALNNLLNAQSGYARTVGSGDSERESTGRGLAQIRKEAMTTLGRSVLMGAV